MNSIRYCISSYFIFVWNEFRDDYTHKGPIVIIAHGSKKLFWSFRKKFIMFEFDYWRHSGEYQYRSMDKYIGKIFWTSGFENIYQYIFTAKFLVNTVILKNHHFVIHKVSFQFVFLLAFLFQISVLFTWRWISYSIPPIYYLTNSPRYRMTFNISAGFVNNFKHSRFFFS